MKRVKLDKDIQPLSEFRANAASIIEKLKRSIVPLLLNNMEKVLLYCLMLVIMSK